jgi:hypothetical protein
MPENRRETRLLRNSNVGGIGEAGRDCFGAVPGLRIAARRASYGVLPNCPARVCWLPDRFKTPFFHSAIKLPQWSRTFRNTLAGRNIKSPFVFWTGQLLT